MRVCTQKERHIFLIGEKLMMCVFLCLKTLLLFVFRLGEAESAASLTNFTALLHARKLAIQLMCASLNMPQEDIPIPFPNSTIPWDCHLILHFAAEFKKLAGQNPRRERFSNFVNSKHFTFIFSQNIFILTYKLFVIESEM
jgi:hypothetical protein